VKKTIVINLNVVMAWLIVALIVTGLTATVGYYLGAFSYWPTEVKQLQPVVLADGQTAIEMTCRDVPGSFMQLFGTSDERVVKYYTLDGSEWLSFKRPFSVYIVNGFTIISHKFGMQML